MQHAQPQSQGRIARGPRPRSTSLERYLPPSPLPCLRMGRRVISSWRTAGAVDIGVCWGTSRTLRQTTKLTRVKARIKASAEKTVSNGCTEAAAMAAAEVRIVHPRLGGVLHHHSYLDRTVAVRCPGEAPTSHSSSSSSNHHICLFVCLFT